MSGGAGVPDTPLTWMDAAACTRPGVNPDVFFSKNGGAAAAKRICARCPVRAECRAFGGDDIYGVWGGRQGKGVRDANRKPPQRAGTAGAAGGVR